MRLEQADGRFVQGHLVIQVLNNGVAAARRDYLSQPGSLSTTSVAPPTAQGRPSVNFIRAMPPMAGPSRNTFLVAPSRQPPSTPMSSQNITAQDIGDSLVRMLRM